ncbi:MAG: hypothetical protein OIF32_06965 [Campylobacterales bacterium]|nr:hypothetical protein [Campylobacterales bacterium]
MKLKFIIFLLLVSFASLEAKSGADIAKDLGIAAGSKAIKQWERVFKKKRKMKKLGIDTLSDGDKQALKKYLISHAADSDSPAAAGL